MLILDDAVAWFVGRTLKRVDLVNFPDVADLTPGHES